MNQQATHTLRTLFREIPSFAPGDPRLKAAWRSFKRAYNSQPRNERSSYVDSLSRQVAQLKELAAEQAAQAT